MTLYVYLSRTFILTEKGMKNVYRIDNIWTLVQATTIWARPQLDKQYKSNPLTQEIWK